MDDRCRDTTAPDETEPPTLLAGALKERAHWVICALLNAHHLEWIAVSDASQASSSVDSGYTTLYQAMVETLPGIDPEPKPLLRAYMRETLFAHLPDKPGTRQGDGFLRLFGTGPSATAPNQSGNACPKLDLKVATTRKVPRAVAPTPSPPIAETATPLPKTATPLPLPAPRPPVAPTPVRRLDARDTRLTATPLHFTPVAQLQGTLGPGAPADLRARTLTRVMDWLAVTKQVAVPADWATRSSWEAGTDAAARQAWYESDGTHVAIRFDEPCGEVHGRSWRVEFVLTEHAGQILIGTRVSAMVQTGVARELRPSIPVWIRELVADTPIQVDGRTLHTTPTDVGDDAALDGLVALIRDRTRACAVVVVTIPWSRSPAVALAGRLAHRVAGAAHVFTLSTGLLSRFAELLGEAGMIAAGDARLYARDFDPALAAVRCPVLTAPTWPSTAGMHQLAEACVAQTVALQDPDLDVPSFAQLRQLIVRERRRQERLLQSGQAEQASDALTRLQAENSALDADLAAAEALAKEQQDQVAVLEEAVRERDAQLWLREEQVIQLQQRIATLEADAEPLPASWDEIEAWTLRRYPDRLVLTTAAMRAARNSVYQDYAFVANVITLLADAYWTMRVSAEDAARDAFLALSQTLRVEISPTGDAVNHHRLKGQYRAAWRGHTYTMDLHVSGSSSRDKRRGFRLYFAWDEDKQLVIVGSLPEHLDNRQT